MIEERNPVRSVIRGAPHAAVVEADVGDVRLTRDARHGAGASSPRRADLAPSHPRGGIDMSGGRGRLEGEGSDSKKGERKGR